MTEFLFLPLITVLLAAWGLFMIRVAGGPRLERSDLLHATLAAAIGYASVRTTVAFGSIPYTGPEAVSLSLFGALALLCAWVDHRTAWAPDGLILLLLISGLLTGALLGTGPVGVLWAPVLGLALFLLAQGSWAAQCLLGPRVLTPPDQIALALPVLVFGLTYHAPITWALMCIPLLVFLKTPYPVYRRLRGPAASEAVLDAGLTGSGRSAPVLPIVLTTLLGVLLFRLLKG